jgi:hypothetical protein
MAVFPATEQAGTASGAGFELITDTAAHTGRFFRLYALEASVISAATVQNGSGNTFAAVPLPAGGSIDGVFTSVTLTSGKVVAYKV